MAKFEGYKDIYVFVEQKNGEIANVGYELGEKAGRFHSEPELPGGRRPAGPQHQG